MRRGRSNTEITNHHWLPGGISSFLFFYFLFFFFFLFLFFFFSFSFFLFFKKEGGDEGNDLCIEGGTQYPLL